MRKSKTEMEQPPPDLKETKLIKFKTGGHDSSNNDMELEKLNNEMKRAGNSTNTKILHMAFVSSVVVIIGVSTVWFVQVLLNPLIEGIFKLITFSVLSVSLLFVSTLYKRSRIIKLEAKRSDLEDIRGRLSTGFRISKLDKRNIRVDITEHINALDNQLFSLKDPEASFMKAIQKSLDWFQKYMQKRVNNKSSKHNSEKQPPEQDS